MTKPLVVADKYGIVHSLHISQHPVTGDIRIKVGSSEKAAHIFVDKQELIEYLESVLEELDPEDDQE